MKKIIFIIFFGTLLFQMPTISAAQNASPNTQGSTSELSSEVSTPMQHVFLPILQVNSEPIQKTFEWKYSENEVRAASLASVNSFGQSWINDKLESCNNEKSLTKEEEFDCRMLKYTMVGKFTQADLEKIEAHSGYLLRVSEGSFRAPKRGSVIAAQTGTAHHIITNENLTASVSTSWWRNDFTHKAWAGSCCHTVPTQYIISMDARANGSYSYYDYVGPVHFDDLIGPHVGPNVPAGQQNYSVHTYACFFASDGVYEATECVNSGSLTY